MEKILSDIQSILISTPERWLRLAQALSDDMLQRQPLEGEWSAHECLAHIVDTEEVFNFRIQCFQEGKDFPGFNPDAEGTKEAPTIKDLAVRFGYVRQESLKKLESLTVKDLDRTARHAELGLVTLRQMLNEWAAHDLMHTVQAERALMQPFIDESGPWQRYFLDHWVGADK
jgi:uncharacterized damage-inducible protein DinB